MASIQDLLPDPESSVLCADFSRSLQLRPAGTGIRADRLVLIETPLPWPKPVFDHPRLTGIQEVFNQSSTVTRVLAMVGAKVQTSQQKSRTDTSLQDGQADSSPRPDAVVVQVFDRRTDQDSPWVEEYRLQVAVQDLLAVAEALSAQPIGNELEAVLASRLTSRGPLEHPAVLICTQGSHDICCGSYGVLSLIHI